MLRLMHEEVHPLKQIEQIDIPVDVRILDITNEFMGGDYTDCEADKYEIRSFWGKFCRDFGFVPVKVDQPLWLLSKNWDAIGEQYILNKIESIRG